MMWQPWPMSLVMRTLPASGRPQPVHVPSILPLAETASTFGEMVLIERLLDTESDPSVRQTLLFRQVDDAYATVMRQAQFALFERQAHDTGSAWSDD